MASQEQLTRVAILGPDTLVEDILARLLEDVGYEVRLIEESHPGERHFQDVLEEADIALLAPGLDPAASETFIGTLRSSSSTRHTTPLLSPSSDLKEALLDVEATSVSWQTLFEALVEQIEDTLWPEGTAEKRPPPAKAQAI